VKKSDFTRSEAWELIRARIYQQIDMVTEAALAAEDYATMRYNAGYRDALRTVLLLPDVVLVDADEKAPVATGEVSIANNPRARTSFLG
jgi:hypothetical protein